MLAPSVNDRQRAYLLAIFQVDQEQEAEMRSMPWRRFQQRPKASEWRRLEYDQPVPDIHKPASRLYEAIKKTAPIDQGTGATFAALTSGAWPVVPDLAIEVLSPSDQAELSDRKLGLYRAARTPRLWVIDPRSRTVAVWRQGALHATLTEPDDELELEDLGSGWRLPLRELWALSDS